MPIIPNTAIPKSIQLYFYFKKIAPKIPDHIALILEIEENSLNEMFLTLSEDRMMAFVEKNPLNMNITIFFFVFGIQSDFVL